MSNKVRVPEAIEEMLEELEERSHSYKNKGKREVLQWALGERDEL